MPLPPMTYEMVGHATPHPVPTAIVVAVVLIIAAILPGGNDEAGLPTNTVDESIDDDHPSLWTFP